MEAFAHDAVAFLLRWLHVVAAIAWIGESFYFVMLDRTLQPPRQPQPGLHGESWSVHGGGFYLKQKFLPAPPQLPDELHWSKWKSYTTWLSGFALLAVVYFTAPGVWLVDPRVAALTPLQAVLAAIALLVVAWIGYDLLCRLAGPRDRLLGALVTLLVAAVAFVATVLFAGRAAFLLTGAAVATIMSANVFFVIIPGQKQLVSALSRGEAPDPLPGQRGRQRSVHNTYFTLPVVFAMLSVHYPAAWSHPQAWLLLLLFMAAGALIRQFFVLWHGGGRVWWLPVAGAALLLAALVLMAPRAGSTAVPADVADDAAAASSAEPAVGTPPMAATAVGDDQPVDTAVVGALIDTHCRACHAAKPTMMPSAPKGVAFDTPADLEAHAAAIAQQTAMLRIMPPGNLTGMTDEERELLRRWAATVQAR